MIFRLGGLWLVGLCCAVTVGACIPGSSEVGSMNGGNGGQGPECEAGATKPADDGCNTCTCNDEGSWRCTELACETCEEGTIRPAGDGCNTCSCTGGEWQCTLVECQTCTVGERRDTECGSCWCIDNGGDPTWACTANACTECVQGETKPGENDCSTCVCGPDGHWDCPVVECPECTEGETRAAGDGCNTCQCANGDWACTTKECGTLVCNPGFGDCDGDLTNGCEANLDGRRRETDEIGPTVENCGSCGNTCAIPGAYAVCLQGVCRLDRCDPPYADCNDDLSDGCESPVGEGGCADRCEPSDPTLVPVAAGASCECPEGMACVRSDLENVPACVPIPKGCTDGLPSCLCMADCVCTEDACYDEMSVSGMIINCGGMP